MSEYIEYGYQSADPHQSHKYLFSVIKNLLADKKKKILDVGCGNGSLVIELLKLGYDAYGIDASIEGITIAKKKYPDRFYILDLSKTHIPSELSDVKFEVIISTEVIEHLHSPRSLISFCKDIFLKNNIKGDLIISTPYHGYFKNLVLAVSNKMDSHFTALWEGGHIKFWSRKSLTKLLTDNGFKVTHFVGCGRLPLLWKSMIVKAELK
ncbi:MAG: class I SAM-dependent methyltransferase [Ignavibacteriota bacterium]|uniref:class I SAM-dependent methyltransferase n=1 Tax=Ignavibacterium album TaxID=591197 RepID=UPI00159A4445|nr:MAG: class I SAM-dependent methyltransferase [Ignavibacteriota bacterium]GIK62074.1 MAG: hypothetical protein BroJett017_29640 [Ignavibacteriota bacterium]